MPRHRISSNAKRMIPINNPGSWFHEMSWFTKLLLLALFTAIALLIYWQITQAIQKRTDNHMRAQIDQGHIDLVHIHILIYAHRCNPHILGKSIFSAFEAAHFPELIHIHLFQEMCVEDDPTFQHGDAYQCYIREYAHQHSTPQTSWESHIHVVNENSADATGLTVSILTLLQESVLATAHNPYDRVILMQPFYDTPGSVNIFPITFAQQYDDLLRNTDIPPNMFYSGRLPRTAQSATNATQFTQLTSSISQAVGSHVLIPFFKKKQHRQYLDSAAPYTCTAKACQNLTLDQVGCTMFTTMDRTAGVSTRQQNQSDVPFTIYRLYRDHYFPFQQFDSSTNVDWDSLLKSSNTAQQIQSPVPIVGLHEDIVIATLDTWKQTVDYAHSSGRSFVQSGPFYIQTVVLSNLCFGVGELRSLNHLPVAAIFDHISGAGATVDPQTLERTRHFRPSGWKTKQKILSNGKVIPLIMDNASEVIELSPEFMEYSGAQPDNVTELGYLGITNQDSGFSYKIKYRTYEELQRQQRMLKGIRST